MNLRGRKASLPQAGHARPEYVSPDGLVVHHYNREGLVRDYDFSTLPVAQPMQRSLAALFADRCVPHIWGVHATSENNWMLLEQFTAFLSRQDHRPADLDGLTVALVKRWRQASNHRKFTMVAGLLSRDARLQAGMVADELSRRTSRPKSTPSPSAKPSSARSPRPPGGHSGRRSRGSGTTPGICTGGEKANSPGTATTGCEVKGWTSSHAPGPCSTTRGRRRTATPFSSRSTGGLSAGRTPR